MRLHDGFIASPVDSGWLQKAVKFEGEDGRIIEELQLFKESQPVDFLQLSSKTVSFTKLVCLSWEEYLHLEFNDSATNL